MVREVNKRRRNRQQEEMRNETKPRCPRNETEKSSKICKNMKEETKEKRKKARRNEERREARMSKKKKRSEKSSKIKKNMKEYTKGTAASETL